LLPEAGVAFDQEAHGGAVAPGGLGDAARHDLVVEHDGQFLDALVELDQPLGLEPADDVVGQQDVIGHAGVGEHLDLAQLLAGDAKGPRLHLHFPERRDLVRLDVRSVADAVLRQVRLHPLQVRLHDVEVDRHRRGIEFADRFHGESLPWPCCGRPAKRGYLWCAAASARAQVGHRRR
jgi:hypothetical protein